MWMNVFGMPPGTPTKKRTSQGSQGNLETRRWRLWLLRIQWKSQLRLQPWRLLRQLCIIPVLQGKLQLVFILIPASSIHTQLVVPRGRNVNIHIQSMQTRLPCLRRNSGVATHRLASRSGWTNILPHRVSTKCTKSFSRKRTKTPMPNTWSEGIWQGSIHPHLPDWPHRAHRPHRPLRAHWHRHHQRNDSPVRSAFSSLILEVPREGFLKNGTPKSSKIIHFRKMFRLNWHLWSHIVRLWWPWMESRTTSCPNLSVGSQQVATRHLVPERRGYSFNIFIAHRREMHLGP